MYGWQDGVVWLIVAAAVYYLWRKLGPGPRSSTTQVIPLKSVVRR